MSSLPSSPPQTNKNNSNSNSSSNSSSHSNNNNNNNSNNNRGGSIPPRDPDHENPNTSSALTRRRQQGTNPYVPSIQPSNSQITASPSTVSASPSISFESPLPPMVQRCLGDRSNEKRKNAALEIEALIKSLQEANNISMIQSVITVLSKDFCTSMNSNYRKGGLIGLAATAIGLHNSTKTYLDFLLPPVLHCFDDPESRVRYYACESLYNICKVSRSHMLLHFNMMFEGLTKLFADVDVDVKNGANLLDRLMKDIVTESSEFNVEIFLPLLQTYIRRTNPFIRQLLVGWITVLDSIPDVSMIDYLPDFLDGLFNMLSDSNREIRQAADSALSDFLREVSVSTVVEFGPIVSILVNQCHSKERLNRLTAITWLAELIHHPYSGGDALLPYHDLILGAIMRCISDGEIEIRLVAERTNDDLLVLVRDTQGNFRLTPLLETLTSELLIKEDVPTKMAALRWINMLMKKRHVDMEEHIPRILPVLLRTLSDPSDPVVLLNLQVLSRISLGTTEKDIEKTATEHEEAQFQLVLTAILHLFCADRHLLETRGSLIIRKLCVLLNAKSVYIRIADALSTYESPEGSTKAESLEFVSTMVQTLNLILLTSSELSDLRGMLQRTFHLEEKELPRTVRQKSRDGAKVFSSLFQCWAHNPVATFSLCLLAQAYDLSFSLIKRFSSMEVTVGFLMQINKLVQLLESPIFVHLRLQLLDVDAPHHAPLLKSLYGLLMLMPQSDAFRSLNDRLTTVCNLRENLGIAPDLLAPGKKVGLNINRLLERFDAVMLQHKQAKQEESAPMTLSRTVMMTPNGKSPGVDGRGGKVQIPMSPTRPSTGGTPVELRAGARKSLSLDLK